MTEQSASIRLSTEHKGRARREAVWIGRYRRAIELAQGGGSAAGPKTTTPEPFELYGGGRAAAPRLFGDINGGHGR
jgi:hypothetical protein